MSARALLWGDQGVWVGVRAARLGSGMISIQIVWPPDITVLVQPSLAHSAMAIPQNKRNGTHTQKCDAYRACFELKRQHVKRTFTLYVEINNTREVHLLLRALLSFCSCSPVSP